jgi:putative transposase
MQVNCAYKYRIYPTKEQKTLLSKHFGCNRFVWNYFLNERKEYYLQNKENIEAKRIQGSLNYYDNAKTLTDLKKKKDSEWLKEVNSQSLQATLKHLDSAYKMFFRKTHQFPNFKNKDSKQSFTIPQFFKLENNKIYIPKFKNGIKVKEHRKLEGKFVVASISKNCSNQYFVSVIVEKEVQNLEKLQTAVGIDVGIKDFAVCSNGAIYENKTILRKKEKKLKFLQRQLSKAKKTSKNRQRKKIKVAKLHQYIKNSRVDYIHKISKEITDKNQIVVLEDLNIAGMLKNHKLAKSISDVSWHEFKRQLEYKASWKGRELVYIDRFFPSSKTCNCCGFINQDLTLSVRDWECPQCKVKLNRDFNASLNILRQGLLKINTAVGITVESVRSCCR